MWPTRNHPRWPRRAFKRATRNAKSKKGDRLSAGDCLTRQGGPWERGRRFEETSDG